MSGIAGIYNRDGRPVERELLGRMTDAIAHRGPDGTRQWIDGAVGFGHQMLCTTPESLHETQPLQDASGQLCLVMDGRVDNCAELRAALRARGAQLRDDTDAELVLQSYIVWGEECPKHIIGDFAFAIRDGRKQQLFCARDFLGIRPFYYYLDERTFRFGSELQQILADANIKRRPNEGMVAEYLNCSITSLTETLYSSIYRLPPAHYMIVNSGKIYYKQYWLVEVLPSVSYYKNEDYGEQFREIFKKAVLARLRSFGLVGAELSGGLDSSSVVSMVQNLHHKGRAKTDNFETFSIIYPGLACDESNYINDVVNRWQVITNQLYSRGPGADYYLEQSRKWQDFPGYPNDAFSMMDIMREKKVRVLLTGLGGDDWLTMGYYLQADLIKEFRFGEFLYYFYRDITAYGMKFAAKRLARGGVWPIIPAFTREALRPALKKNVYNNYICADLAYRTNLVGRIQKEHIRRPPSHLVRWHIYQDVVAGGQVHSNELGNQLLSNISIEDRHPLHDRRLVEFILGMPEKQRHQPFNTKPVLRDAMLNILPDSIQQRQSKAEGSHVLAETLKSFSCQKIFKNLVTGDIGWIDRERTYDKYKMMLSQYSRGDKEYISHVWQLWMVYGIEVWFRVNFLSL